MPIFFVHLSLKWDYSCSWACLPTTKPITWCCSLGSEQKQFCIKYQNRQSRVLWPLAKYWDIYIGMWIINQKIMWSHLSRSGKLGSNWELIMCTFMQLLWLNFLLALSQQNATVYSAILMADSPPHTLRHIILHIAYVSLKRTFVNCQVLQSSSWAVRIAAPHRTFWAQSCTNHLLLPRFCNKNFQGACRGR